MSSRTSWKKPRTLNPWPSSSRNRLILRNSSRPWQSTNRSLISVLALVMRSVRVFSTLWTPITQLRISPRKSPFQCGWEIELEITQRSNPTSSWWRTNNHSAFIQGSMITTRLDSALTEEEWGVYCLQVSLNTWKVELRSLCVRYSTVLEGQV